MIGNRMMQRQRSKPGPAGRSRRGAADQLGYQFKRLMTALRQQFDQVQRRQCAGRSMAQLIALSTLEDEPGATGALLARRALITAQTMNAILRRLERDGCVSRTRQPHNRRADCWLLTAAGSRQLQRTRAAGRPVFQRMLAPLTPAERRQLRRLLERCIAGIEGGGRAR